MQILALINQIYLLLLMCMIYFIYQATLLRISNENARKMKYLLTYEARDGCILCTQRLVGNIYKWPRRA